MNQISTSLRGSAVVDDDAGEKIDLLKLGDGRRIGLIFLFKFLELLLVSDLDGFSALKLVERQRHFFAIYLLANDDLQRIGIWILRQGQIKLDPINRDIPFQHSDRKLYMSSKNSAFIFIRSYSLP
jgi:hypothetical protein